MPLQRLDNALATARQVPLQRLDRFRIIRRFLAIALYQVALPKKNLPLERGRFRIIRRLGIALYQVALPKKNLPLERGRFRIIRRLGIALYQVALPKKKPAS
jgi:hypothetical protein